MNYAYIYIYIYIYVCVCVCVSVCVWICIEYKMDKNQIRTILLSQFKLGRKAAETAHDINEAFGPETTTERTAQYGF